MLKGVNKQVVEISETGNEYFEKAIFFVRPEYSGLGEGRLREKAQSTLSQTVPLPRSGGKAARSAGRGWLVLKLAGAAVSGGTLTAVLMMLINS